MPRMHLNSPLTAMEPLLPVMTAGFIRKCALGVAC